MSKRASVAFFAVCLALAGGEALAAGRTIRAPAAAPTMATQEMLQPVQQVRSAVTAASSGLVSGATVATFAYRENKVYSIAIKPGMFTTFTFPHDEAIKQFAVSSPDAAEVAVNPDTNSAMLRLKSPMSLSATIVTSKHAYYLSIVPSDGGWYQGVSWTYGSPDGNSNDFGYVAPAGSGPVDEAPDDALAGQPNFNYAITGDTSVAPIAVWDNGRFTWLQFPRAVQSLPAVFVVTPDGPEIVNYVVMPGGRQIKVNRLMSKIMLRLGSQKAYVTAK